MIHRVTLDFELDECVSPEHLAQRVAQACAAYGALRPGERVTTRPVQSPPRVFTVSDTPVDVDGLFRL